MFLLSLSFVSLTFLAPASQEASPIVLEVLRPAELGKELQHGILAKHLLRSPAWQELEANPQVAAAKVGIGILLSPVNGEVGEFFDAFAGEGLRVTLRGQEPNVEWALHARGRDGDLAEACLRPVLGLAGVSAQQIAGEEWTITLGEIQLGRRGDHFLAAPKTAGELRMVGDEPLPAGMRIARAACADSQVIAYLSGDVLRAKGYPRYPDDLGASFFGAEVHEALRVAPWAAVALGLTHKGVHVEGITPCGAELRASHAPFFPKVESVAMPSLPGAVLSGSMTRDLGAWWTSRDLYTTEAAVADSVEADSNFALLFGRDPGPEVFAHLEPSMRVLAARLPEKESKGLSIELPGFALGLQLKKDAPEDLSTAFVNAFVAAITFTNFDGGALGDSPFLLGVEPMKGGMLYAARMRQDAAAESRPLRANFSPSLWVGDDGEIWFSSSAGMIQSIVAAPRAAQEVGGVRFSIDGQAAAGYLHTNQQALIAQRALQEGGDVEAATSFIELVTDSVARLHALNFQSARDGNQFRVRIDLDFKAPPQNGVTEGSK
jgi:hypothetical protein